MYGAFGLEGHEMKAYEHTIYALNELERRYIGSLEGSILSPISRYLYI